MAVGAGVAARPAPLSASLSAPSRAAPALVSPASLPAGAGELLEAGLGREVEVCGEVGEVAAACAVAAFEMHAAAGPDEAAQVTGENVRAEVEVLGDERIKHIIDGQTVLSYEKPQIGGRAVNNYDPEVKKDGAPLSEGYISLQSESHPVEFRKVELLNLVGCMDQKASNYKSYFVKADNSKCQYAK